jgi:mRNA-degrading endonuclease RelE of RelBE toxin-antitoxin system
MKLVYSESFNKQCNKLPESVQTQFQKQTELLVQNQRHPSLHFKKLQDKKNVYSIRIASSYRALFLLQDDTAIFFALGHRKDIYR